GLFITPPSRWCARGSFPHNVIGGIDTSELARIRNFFGRKVTVKLPPLDATHKPMNDSPAHDITKLLLGWRGGHQTALDQLMPLVYRELHRLAHHFMDHERAGGLLQTTALVNEAYLRLVDSSRVQYESRAHFFAIAGQLMRRVLVDVARERLSQKRGGEW